MNANTTAENDLIRIEEASNLTGLKVSSIYVKVSRGELPHYKQFGKLFFSRSELLDMINKGRRQTPVELQANLDRRLYK